jgi:hypothetical protein
MKTWKILTITVLSVLALALLTSSAYAFIGGWGMMGGGYGGYGGGMMGGGYGYGPYNPAYPTQPGLTTPATPTGQYYQPVYPFQFGGGCMGTYGWNGYGYQQAPYTYTGTTLNITTATTIANNYVASLNNPDLAVREIEEYSLNFYVQIYEKSTGIGAFEMLINKYTGSIYPEMGPNMMWNTKYGMMRGGILGGIFGTPMATMPLTAEQAEADAQQWLNTYIPGTTAEEAEPFYGYYHVMVESAGEGYGMLSVNGYTGQVWFHNWHGTFIQELEIS